MSDCIFCRIAEGEIPCTKVYEDDNFLAFLDLKPLSKGHALVIPKKHYRWVWDVENIGEYFEVCRKIALAQKKAFDTDAVSSMIFGEEVPHAHIWLVPRSGGSGRDLDLRNTLSFSKEEMQEFAEKIKSFL